MNVSHVNDEEIPVPANERDRLALIFERQAELHHRYVPIEEKNGFYCPPIPCNLHAVEDQARLKDYAWRITEELAESSEALESHEDQDVAKLHQLEELSDAMHFLVELLIVVGHTPGTLYDEWSLHLCMQKLDARCRLDQMFFRQSTSAGRSIMRLHNPNIDMYYSVVEALGKSMNCLKNKPWKQTHLMTDVRKFNEHLIEAWCRFIDLAIELGLSADDLFKVYWKKSKVNEFRQRSKY
jgi:dimeric dUTPase (all-alpha-NTP-PPase superfamily)